MAWMTLAEALEAAVARGLGIGDGGIGVPTGADEMDAEKSRGVATPAVGASDEPSPRKRPVLRNVKCEPTQTPAPPQRRVGSHLKLIEGCGGSPEGGTDFRRYRSSRQGGTAREMVRLVHASSL